MKVKYLRGYDPEEIIEVICISPGLDRPTEGFPYLVLTQPDGEQVYATYCNLGSDGTFIAGLPENF